MYYFLAAILLCLAAGISAHKVCPELGCDPPIPNVPIDPCAPQTGRRFSSGATALARGCSGGSRTGSGGILGRKLVVSRRRIGAASDIEGWATAGGSVTGVRDPCGARGARCSPTGFAGAGMAVVDVVSPAQTACAGNMPCNRPRPAGKVCILGRCYDNVNAQTDGGAVGSLTQASGNSAVSTGAAGVHGLATHEAAGHGVGRSGASSASKIQSQDMFGFESLQSGSKAEAVGDMSSSLTRSNSQTMNGMSFTGSRASGAANGYGHSASKTGASAGGCGLSIC